MNVKNKKMIESLTHDLLKEIGEDPSREGLLKTPERVSKAWEYFSQGYRLSLDDIINDAIFTESSEDMVIVRDIEFFSFCEHNLYHSLEKHMLDIYPIVKLLDYLKSQELLTCIQGDSRYRNV